MAVDQSHINLLDVIPDASSFKLASRSKDQYAGSCPFCGGEDRFIIWCNDTPQRYWCRKCNASGDAITFVMEYDNLDFPEACKKLGLGHGLTDRRTRPSRRPTYHSRPLKTRQKPSKIQVQQNVLALTDPEWRRSAALFVRMSQDTLWHLEHGARARDYLIQRGITEALARTMGLGYNPNTYNSKERQDVAWGTAYPWVAPGIVLPVYEQGRLRRVFIRQRDNQKPKYIVVSGSANVPYNMDALTMGCVVILVEGVFDALTLMLYAETHNICPIALGSTTHGRLDKYITLLRTLPSRVLVMMDGDDAGNAAAELWLSKLGNKAQRLYPTEAGKDINDMLMGGEDIDSWLQGVSRRSLH